MEISFTPSPDVSAVLNRLLDTLERRASQSARRSTEHGPRSIKVTLEDLGLPAYFSQMDPGPRLTANEQLVALERAGFLRLAWMHGETGHLLQSVVLQAEHAAHIYAVLHRSAKTDQLNRLESLLLADKFRFEDDWRARALGHVLRNLRGGKSTAPFSLTDTTLDADLLTVIEAIPLLQAETPYRVFSVRIFNDSKRLEAFKSQLVSLARLGNSEWKRLSAEEVLRELNLVPNPNYLHLAGDWQLTLENGEILSLGGFNPSIGFPAAQTARLYSVQVHADAVLAIENLTTFHEFIHKNPAVPTMDWSGSAGSAPEAVVGSAGLRYAVLCTYGNPSPAIRRLLRLIPDSTPIYHWSDLDYGGFNILSQLRRLVSRRVQACRMDRVTLDANFKRARPLTVADRANLKKLLGRPELADVREVIEHLLSRGLKLEQEGVEI